MEPKATKIGTKTLIMYQDSLLTSSEGTIWCKMEFQVFTKSAGVLIDYGLCISQSFH